MKKTIYFLGVFLMVAMMQSNGIAQGLDTVWTRTCGGDDDDYGFSITETIDGGIVITGCTRSDGLMSFFDIYTIKFNSYGDILWAKTYGSPLHDIGYSVQETMDNGLIVAGASFSSFLGSESALLIKMEANGDTVWTKRYNGAFMDVLELDGGEFVAVGFTYPDGPGNSDIYLIKTDMFGDTLWTKTIGGNYNDYGKAIKQTGDDGFIICGTTYSGGTGFSDLYLVKVNNLGDTLWTRTFGDEYSDFGNDVIVSQDNNFVAVGTTNSYEPDEVNIYIIKIDVYGNMIWSSIVGGGSLNIGNSICEMNDGNLLINGTTKLYGMEYSDGCLIELNNIGDTIWTQIYGGYDPDEGTDLLVSADGSVYLVGLTESFGTGDPDVYLLKLFSTETGLYENQTDGITAVGLLSKCSPNPFNSYLAIQYTLFEQSEVNVEIYDMLGRRIELFVQGTRQAGEHNVIWNADNQSSGIYFYRVRAGDYSETRKMVLLR